MGAGIAGFWYTGHFDAMLDYVHSLQLGPSIIYGTKCFLAYPLVYHYTNGMRHLVRICLYYLSSFVIWWLIPLTRCRPGITPLALTWRRLILLVALSSSSPSSLHLPWHQSKPKLHVLMAANLQIVESIYMLSLCLLAKPNLLLVNSPWHFHFVKVCFPIMH